MIRRWVVAGCAMAAILALPRAASAADLTVGFNGYYDLLQQSPQDQALIVQRMRSAGGRYVRIPATWSAVATARPPADRASDPTWAGYDWAPIDRAVSAIAAGGMRPLVVVNHAPRWAEGPHRPPVSDEVPAGSWRPSPSKLRAFAIALARRYSGHFRLATGEVLPRVRYFQAWNEPNLRGDLSPQYVRRRDRLRPAAAVLYRSLLNAFYAGVKSVSPSAIVLAAATAPFGDYPATSTSSRTPPLVFQRELLCLRPDGRPRPRRCPSRPRFDVLAFNTFPATPYGHAAQPADLYIGDASRLIRALQTAEHAGTTLPRKRHRVWLTEFCWQTRDVAPGQGVSWATQARYVDQALYIAWREHIRTALWWQIRDAPPEGAFEPGSGLYSRGPSVTGDRAKPALRRFAFPFLVVRHGRGTRVWGLAPRAGAKVRIQQRVGSRWRRIATLRGGGRVFTSKRVRTPSRRLFRAVSAGRTSPAVRAP